MEGRELQIEFEGIRWEHPLTRSAAITIEGVVHVRGVWRAEGPKSQ